MGTYVKGRQVNIRFVEGAKEMKNMMQKRWMFVGALMAFGLFLTFPGKVQAAKKPLVISFVHRDNITGAKEMDVDALSSATVYSGPTGEKKSTIEVIRDTLVEGKKAKKYAIRVKDTYSPNYNTTVSRADDEIDKNTPLKLKKPKVNLDPYKTIYLCTPIWHVSLPQPVKVFLEANDFTGKTIYVFGTHLGSGFGQNVALVRNLCPGAKVKQGKTYLGDASNASVKKSVKKWLKKH